VAKKDTEKTKLEPAEDEAEIIEEVEDIPGDDSDEITEDDFEDEPEADHIPLSARILRVLAILAIGAAGALWAAPKIAPMLPTGLKPVAEFLAPQTDVTDQLAALQAKMEDRLAAIETTNTPQDALAQITARLDDLGRKNADLATSLDTLSKTTGTLEASVASLQSEMANMTARQALTSQNGQISEEALQQFQEKLAAITAAQQKLNQSQADAVDAQRDASGKLRLAAATSALAQISDALKTGAAFQKPLDKLVTTAGISPSAILSDNAATGVASLSELKRQFPALARVALRDTAAAQTGGSAFGKFTSFLKSQVGTRSLEPRQGDDLDAVLSRIEAALETGNLGAALTETDKLDDPASKTLNTWIAKLKQLNDAKQSVQALQKQLATTLN
jgi:hypothetical protein